MLSHIHGNPRTQKLPINSQGGSCSSSTILIILLLRVFQECLADLFSAVPGLLDQEVIVFLSFTKGFRGKPVFSSKIQRRPSSYLVSQHLDSICCVICAVELRTTSRQTQLIYVNGTTLQLSAMHMAAVQ